MDAPILEWNIDNNYAKIRNNSLSSENKSDHPP